MTDLLRIDQVEGENVVDSRLIATELEVQHESFIANLKKHQVKLEEKFGGIRFEIGVPETPTGNPPKFAWLNENQATALMTLSKNTDRVVELKLTLVDSFSKAKKIIKEVINQQVEKQPVIPSRVVALETSRTITEIDNSLSKTHPRLAQILIDHAISDILPSEKLLNGDRLRGVVEIAEAMGFKDATIKRCNLGKYVKRLCGHLASQEERLVHGTMRAVACYPEKNEEVKTAIYNFFN